MQQIIPKANKWEALLYNLEALSRASDSLSSLLPEDSANYDSVRLPGILYLTMPSYLGNDLQEVFLNVVQQDRH